MSDLGFRYPEEQMYSGCLCWVCVSIQVSREFKTAVTVWNVSFPKPSSFRWILLKCFALGQGVCFSNQRSFWDMCPSLDPLSGEMWWVSVGACLLCQQALWTKAVWHMDTIHFHTWNLLNCSTIGWIPILVNVPHLQLMQKLHKIFQSFTL